MNLIRIFITLFFFGLLSAHAVGARQPQIHQSNVSNAVAQTTITALFRDEAGILWVGTQYGLYRLNGYDERLFSSNKSTDDWIPASDIRAITETKEGKILVATFGGGALIFDDESNSFQQIRLKTSEPDLFLNGIYYSNTDWLWLLSAKSLHIVDLNGSAIDDRFVDSITHLRNPIKLIGNGKGLVVLATKNDGLWVIDVNNRIKNRLDKPNGSKLDALAISFGKEEGLYVGANDGHVWYFPNESLFDGSIKPWVILDVQPPISSVAMQGSTIWVGTSNGLYGLDNETNSSQKFDTDNSEIANNHVTDLFRDGSTTWIGTYQGLSEVRFSDFDIVNKKRGGISDDVLAFEEDQYGNLWIGTYGGLFRLSGRAEEGNSADPIQTRDARIMTLARKDNEIWIGFRQAGIEVLDTKTLETKKSEILPKARLAVTKILHDCRGWTWIATFGDGLYLVRAQEVTSLKEAGIFEENFVTILFQLGDCTLLVGTETSMYRYDVDTNLFVQMDLSYPDSSEQALILSIGEDSNGNIWLGTKDRGLFSLSKEKMDRQDFDLIKPEVDSRINNVSVYGMELDQSDKLWISTQVGLFKLDNNGKLLDHFDKSEGLQGNDFNFGASYKDSEGKLYFGGLNGFSRFNPAGLENNAEVSDLFLAGIEYNLGSEIKKIDSPKFNSIVLDRHNHFITFQFSVLDFLDPENNKFRHKLENFDPEWIDIGTRKSATYTNLPPGEYFFRVQGSNSAGIWNREGVSIQVTVLPPPWKTWWAYIGYTILTLLLFWLAVRTYKSFLLRRAKADLEAEMHENAERAYDELHEQFELHDGLARAAHEHSKNTLQTIGDYLSNQRDFLTDPACEDALCVSSSLIAALATLEACMYYSNDRLTGNLHRFTERRMAELLASSSLDAERLISINEVTDQRIPADIATPLAIFINEALENALRHAFEATSPVNYLQVALQITTISDHSLDNRYKLAISDSGVGIPESISPANLETRGFKTMYSIANKLSGEVEFDVGDGTRITLVFRTDLRE